MINLRRLPYVYYDEISKHSVAVIRSKDGKRVHIQCANKRYAQEVIKLRHVPMPKLNDEDIKLVNGIPSLVGFIKDLSSYVEKVKKETKEEMIEKMKETFNHDPSIRNT